MLLSANNRNAQGKAKEENVRPGRIQTFAGQFWRYFALISSLTKSLFSYSPWLMAKLLVLTVIGTSLQGFSLASTLFILKNTDAQLLVEIGKLQPLLTGKVHVAFLLTGILALLGVAIYFLYISEKVAIEFSKNFATHCGVKMISRFPEISRRLTDPSINPRTGIPSAFNKEVKTQTLKLDMASLRLLGSPMAFLQLLLGAGFLLYLEPLLTCILVLISLPLLVPLKRLTMAIREYERLRLAAPKINYKDVISMAQESARLLLAQESLKQHFTESFAESGFAVSTKYRAARRKALSGSRAVAMTALVINGIASMMYFLLFYTGKEFQIATIVVYFGALRISVMSGKQLVSRISSLARFHETVQKYIGDESITALKGKLTAAPQVFGIQGPDLKNNGSKDLTIKGNGPFAVTGLFPLLAINRYELALPLMNMNAKKSAAVISEMAVVTEDLDLNLEITWREFIGIERDQRFADENLLNCCRIFDPYTILQNVDVPLKTYRNNRKWTQPETVEALLLRAFFSKSPFVVARETALIQLGNSEAEHWKQILSDRLLFVYYQYGKQPIGKWGEEYVALVGSDAWAPIGIAPVAWANADKDRIERLLRNAVKGGSSTDDEDLEWDENDDDDD